MGAPDSSIVADPEARRAGPGDIWDESQGRACGHLAEQFEALWRKSRSGRPDAARFLRKAGVDSPAAWLAVLGRELALRREAGDRIRAAELLSRHPWLENPVRVGLLYEEFCLREEAGERPNSADTIRQHPELASALGRLLAIHDFVGSSTSTMLQLACREAETPPLPEAGETIGGFHLHEELGQGALARVFRAAERQLADRPVVLKVSWRGSNEPQTLARLQHTHIVPIFSYRSDPVTGLHLLCMPYFGRVTLARLLDEPGMRTAMSGSDILDILAALDPEQAERGESATRLKPPLADLPFTHAIAWLGARLAEALQHAHEHGVLHGDIKPSNVLITADGRPMLLDFNLARAAWAQPDDPAPSAPGGTFSYMAPEHLEALADGDTSRVDARADIYSLGILLYEAMGARPFADRPAPGATTMADLLHAAATTRRLKAPRLREQFPEVPQAFEAIVRTCLEPEPGARYPTAGALAADLQALVEDRPLRYTREAFLSRSRRGIRRHRVRLVLTASLMITAASAISTIVYRHIEVLRLEARAWYSISEATTAERLGQEDEAISAFRTAEQLADGDSQLEPLRARASERRLAAEKRRAITLRAQQVFREGRRLRFALLGFGSDQPDVIVLLKTHLTPLHVFGPGDWPSALPDLHLLGTDAERLRLEVEELLFFGAIALAVDARTSPEAAAPAADLCRIALKFTQTREPWQALLDRMEAAATSHDTRTDPAHTPASTDSARACVQWGVIHAVVDRDRHAESITWLERAVQIDQTRYWAHYFLADLALHTGDHTRAEVHYTAALTADPNSPWAYFGMAQAHAGMGRWDESDENLNQAIKLAEEQDLEFPEAFAIRARAVRRLGCVHAAIQDLDHASELADDRPDLMPLLLWEYALCFPESSACWSHIWDTAARIGRLRGARALPMWRSFALPLLRGDIAIPSGTRFASP